MIALVPGLSLLIIISWKLKGSGLNKRWLARTLNKPVVVVNKIRYGYYENLEYLVLKCSFLDDETGPYKQ